MKPWEWFYFPWRVCRGRTNNNKKKVKSNTVKKNNLERARKEICGDERGAAITEVGRKVKKRDIMEAKGEKSFSSIRRYGVV